MQRKRSAGSLLAQTCSQATHLPGPGSLWGHLALYSYPPKVRAIDTPTSACTSTAGSDPCRGPTESLPHQPTLSCRIRAACGSSPHCESP